MSFYTNDYNVCYGGNAAQNEVAESAIKNDNAAFGHPPSLGSESSSISPDASAMRVGQPNNGVLNDENFSPRGEVPAERQRTPPPNGSATAGQPPTQGIVELTRRGSSIASPLEPSSHHSHTDTYEQPLPPEALGARQLIDYIFSRHAPGCLQSALSRLSDDSHPRRREVGWPMPLPAEPVNPSNGRRLVYFGQSLRPQFVLAEQKNRFIAVEFKPVLPAGAAAAAGADPNPGAATSPTRYTSFGTVLGYSDDNTRIVWHDRSERFASCISLASIQSVHRAAAMQCKHCGFVLLKLELHEHMSTHKKGSGVEYGVFTDDDELGLLCGDSGLMQNLTSPRRLGEGAQGVVDLMNVVQPTSAELQQAGPTSAVYNFRSQHLAHASRLQKVVVKSMFFSSDKMGLQEYQKSVRFMTVMQHPHLVEYLAVQLKPDHRTVRICMPYYEEGDVSTMIRDFRGDHFEESFVCSVALQLSLALAFLHERNPPIVHGDLKVENVMFYNHKQQIVLMDLDASREVSVGNQEAVQSSLGTTAYMAPETLKVERLMPSSDMWSLGVFLYVLTVLPDFPMILNPNTQNLDLLNADSWATLEDLFAMESYSASALGGGRSNTASALTGQGNRGITLGECVRANVVRKGFSDDLAQLIVDLLSYNPLRRPTAHVVGGRLTDIMTKYLLDH
ncbi:putative protein kinase [Leptomonas pyrrhocoris]|uniref:Protein kinase domain-containing protein n=1 Tax=Leptomonas pyrrhocoris TaxID=157538 RepID=A0A0M9FXD8_LEPPY|nr:putative protein kinase [Leptomonas pyrrhocoris]KPA77899.1 putative protein kinase [Leptomonas pyrrhocoris]|eukprot:XP_015656338.1 putative protein kinase [Leptomonas pyrrhocoris]